MDHRDPQRAQPGRTPPVFTCGCVGCQTCTRSLTSAVPEVGVAWRVVLAEPLQDLLVVHEPVQRAQEEGVERQVTHLLQLKVSAEMLQPPGALDGVLQGLQGLAVLPKVSGQVLRAEGGWSWSARSHQCDSNKRNLCGSLFYRSLFFSDGDETTGQALLVTS